MKMLEKLQKRLQAGKKDNKGFSLVELIIVIAIMAILVGIVGMTVLPQIDNSRKAKDIQILSALLTEATEAYTQVKHADGDYTVTITCSGGSITNVATDYAGDADLVNAIIALGSPRTLSSKDGKALTQIVIECQSSTLTDPAVTLSAANFESISSS